MQAARLGQGAGEWTQLDVSRGRRSWSCSARAAHSTRLGQVLVPRARLTSPRENRLMRAAGLPNKGMKLTSVEHIGRSQLIPGVRPMRSSGTNGCAGKAGAVIALHRRHGSALLAGKERNWALTLRDLCAFRRTNWQFAGAAAWHLAANRHLTRCASGAAKRRHQALKAAGPHQLARSHRAPPRPWLGAEYCDSDRNSHSEACSGPRACQPQC